MRKCSCGFLVGSPDFIFCPKCGAKLPETEKSEKEPRGFGSDLIAAGIASALTDAEIRNQVALIISRTIHQLAKRFDL